MAGFALPPPYGTGYGGPAGRYGTRFNQATPGIATGIDNLAKAFLGGPTPAAQDAQEAQTELRRQQADLTNAKLRQIASKMQGEASAQQEQQVAPANYVSTRFGVPGQETLDYLAGKIVPSKPETAEQPGIVGGYPTPAPPGVGPQEDVIRAAVAGLQASKMLPGKTTFEGFQKGLGEEQKQGMVRGVVGGSVDPTKVAQAFYAAGGHDPYKLGSHGESFSPLTGAADASGIVPQAYVGERRGAEAHQRAAAGASSAVAEKTRSETLPQVTLQTPQGPVVATGRDVGHEAAKAQFGAGNAALQPEALGPMAWDSLLIGKNPPGMGTASAGQRAQVALQRAQIGHSLGLSDAEIAMLPIDNKVKMKALGNMVNWGAFVNKAADQVGQSMDAAIEVAKQIDPTALRTLNKLILAGRLEFNDPLVNKYATLVNTASREYARLISGPTSNAMLPVEAMKKSESMLSTALDVPALQGVRDAMKIDADITRRAVQGQVDGLRGGMVPGGAPKGSGAAPGAAPLAFANEAEAQAAAAAGTLQPGMRITVGGTPGTWH